MSLPRSLTSRLVLTTVALILLASTLIAAITTLLVRDYLTDQLDDDVRSTVRGDDHGPIPGPDRPGRPSPQFRLASPGTLIADLDLEFGRVLPDGDALSQDALDALAKVPDDGEVHAVDVPGEGSYRVLLTDGGGYVLGLPTDRVDQVVSDLLSAEVALTVLAVLAGGGAAAYVVRRQLRPLREVAATAHTVAELPLASGAVGVTERVPAHLTDERTEVGQVGAALNTLLAHVDTSLQARHRSEQQVRQFVADASHELRTPLTTITGYTELARRRPDDPAVVRTALGKVEDEAGRMTALVEDLLLLARLDAGRPLERQPVDLTRLLVEAVSDARVVAPDHHWRVEVPDALVDSPAVVTGDPLRLHQVATNLLTNARKHTPAGTTVTVTVRRDGFTVHDDGPGFAPELVGHAFERFARGDAARTRGAEVGVGLGLALVRAIVEAHGGQVTLASTPGDTTVTVTLPTG